MNILFATPYKQGSGGIVQWAQHIMSHYATAKTGVNIDILAMNDPKGEDPSLNKTLSYRVRYGIRTYSLAIKNLMDMLKKKKYDILHIASSASLSLIKDIIMMCIAKRNGIKVVLHFHFGRIPELARLNNWEWKLLKRAVKISSKTIVLDQQSHKALIDNGLPNVSIISNPLSPNVVHIINNNKTTKREDNLILFVGHCVKTKGVYELVEACKEIPNVKLILLGTITDNVKEDLINIAESKLNLNIEGQQPYEYVIKQMMACDIFVLPTYTEGFPNVIIESMACGCPIITTPVGAIPEMLNSDDMGDYGLMVEPKNVGQLKKAIEKMLYDKEFKQNCGANAKKRVFERYNIDIVWTQMVKVWQQLMI